MIAADVGCKHLNKVMGNYAVFQADAAGALEFVGNGIPKRVMPNA